MSQNDYEQMLSILQRMRELANEADKGLGIHKYEQFQKLNNEHLAILDEVNLLIEKE